MGTCNCRLCWGAEKQDLTSAEWVEWLEHRDDYALRVELPRDLYIYVEDSLTEMYYTRARDPRVTNADRAGLTLFDVQTWIEEIGTEAVPIAESPFRFVFQDFGRAEGRCRVLASV